MPYLNKLPVLGPSGKSALVFAKASKSAGAMVSRWQVYLNLANAWACSQKKKVAAEQLCQFYPWYQLYATLTPTLPSQPTALTAGHNYTVPVLYIHVGFWLQG